MAPDGSRWARWIGRTGRYLGRPAGRAAVDDAVAAPPERDLDQPLFDVCFAVIDVETTGGSPHSAALTEIAAATYRGGECTGAFQTLVDPGCDVPPLITLLTGITSAMVCDAPPVSSVLPSFLEFVRGTVIVGHNVRFDIGFLDAALAAHDRDPLGNVAIDTLALARRLVGPDVPNCRLRTLAHALRLAHQPTHRALDDVRATADLLHRLIEDATGYGVFALGDLLDLMTSGRLRVASVS